MSWCHDTRRAKTPTASDYVNEQSCCAQHCSGQHECREWNRSQKKLILNSSYYKMAGRRRWPITQATHHIPKSAKKSSALFSSTDFFFGETTGVVSITGGFFGNSFGGEAGSATGFASAGFSGE